MGAGSGGGVDRARQGEAEREAEKEIIRRAIKIF